MASTYDKIATYTLPSATASYTFTSIPSTYTDLVLIMNGGLAIADYPAFQVNGDTGANYSYTTLVGTGSVAASGRASGSAYGFFDSAPVTANGEWNGIAHFQNYSNSTTYKTVIARNNSAISGGGTRATVSLWRNTAAITSIKIYTTGASNYVTGSTFTLYGIKAA